MLRAFTRSAALLTILSAAIVGTNGCSASPAPVVNVTPSSPTLALSTTKSATITASENGGSGFFTVPPAGVNAGSRLLYISCDGGNVNVYSQAGKGQQPLMTIVDATGGLAIDGSGDLYVADIGYAAVFVFHQGAVKPYKTLTGAGSPETVAVDSQGTVYTNNHFTNTVSVFAGGSSTPTSTLTAHFTDQSATVALDAAGDLFVDDTSGEVDEFPAGSTTPTVLGTTLGIATWGMAFDKNQNLLVSDPLHHGISVYAPPYTGKPKRKVQLKEEAWVLAFGGSDSALWLADSAKLVGTQVTYPGFKTVESTSNKNLGGRLYGIATYPPAPH
jgi:hypothetical protein